VPTGYKYAVSACCPGLWNSTYAYAVPDRSSVAVAVRVMDIEAVVVSRAVGANCRLDRVGGVMSNCCACMAQHNRDRNTEPASRRIANRKEYIRLALFTGTFSKSLAMQSGDGTVQAAKTAQRAAPRMDNMVL
jgi:hypothetical protein